MSGYSLEPGISFCDAGGRHVFLDLAADRYFCLSSAAERAFGCLVAGRPLETTDRDQLDALERQGLLCAVENGGFTSAPDSCARATRSLFDETISVSPAHVAVAAAALLHAKWSLRMRSLDHLVSHVRSAKSLLVASGWDEERLAAIAAAFRRAALLTGSLNQCLASSLAISHRALAHGIATDLVLGVKLRPFQAHAWVQAGELLVSDLLDRVAPFKPVLVI